MSGRWFLPRRAELGRARPARWDREGGRGGRSVPSVARGWPCAQPGVRFVVPSDAVAAGAAAVLCLRDCTVLCWNSPCFDLRLGTPIAVERPCRALSGCRIFTPHFPFLCIQRIVMFWQIYFPHFSCLVGISSYVGLNFNRLLLCPFFEIRTEV